jgi:hypothetical protein
MKKYDGALTLEQFIGQIESVIQFVSMKAIMLRHQIEGIICKAQCFGVSNEDESHTPPTTGNVITAILMDFPSAEDLP